MNFYWAKCLIALLLSLASLAELHGRPVYIPKMAELEAKATLIAIIRPKSFVNTEDKPDDGSFGDRDLARYQALETTCEVVSVLKGKAGEEIKLVHFRYGNKSEFNGGMFMSFLFAPVRLWTVPANKGKPGDRKIPYADGPPPQNTWPTCASCRTGAMPPRGISMTLPLPFAS